MDTTMTKRGFDEFVRNSAYEFRNEFHKKGYELAFGISFIGYDGDWCVTDYCIDVVEFPDINKYSMEDIIRIAVEAENNLENIPDGVAEVVVLLEALAVDGEGSYSFVEANIGTIHVWNGHTSWLNID